MRNVWLLSLSLFMLLLVSCSDDEYNYPSVRRDFLTVVSGDNGYLEMLIPDKGESLTVSEDRTKSKITPNGSIRVVSNYEVLSLKGGAQAARIYGISSVVAPSPKLAVDFPQGVKTDPVDVLSIWMGRGYLNMILNIKTENSQQHLFHFVEEDVALNNGVKTVTILLYHDAGSGEEFYTKRAYLSIPLEKYVDAMEPVTEKVVVKFKYWTRDRDGKMYLEDKKYTDPGFIYEVPAKD